MVCPPRDAQTLSGRALSARQSDLTVRMISIGQPHRAVPITGAICVAVAARVPGTVPQQICATDTGPIRIAHPSGTTVVDATVSLEAGRPPRAHYGAVYRSARRLFEGHVLCRSPIQADLK
jgi:2-methylaconitate cis-trans-isomerase PrpF